MIGSLGAVRLRDVTENDLPIFYEQQLDPEATRMAAYSPRDRQAFMAHWAKIMGDEAVVLKTILYHEQVVGNVVSFVHTGKREVGYLLGKKYWGKGIATRALSQFLDFVTARPLYAHVAKHNVASIRVLEKCGFKMVGENKDFGFVDGKVVEGWILMLEL